MSSSNAVAAAHGEDNRWRALHDGDSRWYGQRLFISYVRRQACIGRVVTSFGRHGIGEQDDVIHSRHAGDSRRRRGGMVSSMFDIRRLRRRLPGRRR